MLITDEADRRVLSAAAAASSNMLDKERIMRNSVLSLMVFIALFTGGHFLIVAQAQSIPQVAVDQTSNAASSNQQVAKEAALKSAEMTTSYATNPQWQPPSDWALYGVPIIVLFGSLITILAIRKALPANWSLSDALSEDVQMPVFKTVTTKSESGKPDVTTKEPVYDKDQKPILAPEMRASSSRLIALMGMIVILFMFIGFGAFALYGFGKNGSMPQGIDRVVSFLVAGMTLFAPYVVNKFASLLQGLTSGK
jgi:hypothetical protein